MNDHPLRCSVFVAILLRLFAIYWVLMAVFSLPGSLTLLLQAYPGGSIGSLVAVRLLHLAVPVLYGFFAVMAWIFAGRIGEKVAGEGDPLIPLRNVSGEGLLTFGILVTGLHHFLMNLGDSINWLHYLAVTKGIRINEFTPPAERNPFYLLTTSLVPCLAGLAAAIASPSLGRKLAKRCPAPGS